MSLGEYAYCLFYELYMEGDKLGRKPQWWDVPSWEKEIWEKIAISVVRYAGGADT